MSGVNITVLEGGKAENFGQVTKLRTSNGSGHDLWVPKSDVETKHLSVKKNGLHYTNQYEPTASEKKSGKFHDIYGWDTITVSVKQKTKGKKKKKKVNPDGSITETDVPVAVTVDDNGNLVEEELPTSIKIIENPTTVNYVDGQSISIAGIKVKAYLDDGTEWGDVPYNELMFEPTVASYGSADEYSDDDGVNAILSTANAGLFGWDDYQKFTCNQYLFSTLNATALYTYYDGHVYIMPRITTKYGFSNTIWGGGGAAASRKQFSDVFLRYCPCIYDYKESIPVSIKDPTGVSYDDLHSVGGKQEITVSWIHPDDEIELSDTYEITVGVGPTPPNGNTGSNTGDNTGSDLGEDPDHPITPHI